MLSLRDRQHLVTNNLGIAGAVVRDMLRACPALRRHKSDLQQAAYLGLVVAANRYDPKRAKFITYAWSWARYYANTAGREATNPVTVTQTARQLFFGSASTDAIAELPAHTPDADDLVDHRRLRGRVQRRLVRALRKAAKRKYRSHDNAERDADIFMRGEFEGAEGLAREYGVHPGTVTNLKAVVRPHFDAIAAAIRSEAA